MAAGIFVLLAVLAGCGRHIGREDAVTGMPPPSAGGTLSGSALDESDVQTVPNAPVPAGVVIVVPGAAIGEFWVSMGQPATGPAEPHRAEFTVEPAVLPAAAEVAPITAGRFASRLGGPGALFCLAPSDASAAGGEVTPSYRVVGCALMSRTDPAAREVTLARGEAGVTIRAG